MKHFKIFTTALKTSFKIKTTTYDNLTVFAQNLGYTVLYSNEIPNPAITDTKNKLIVISNTLSQAYARKCLAHEIGHILLKHKLLFADDCIQNDNEANFFAACLLNIKIINILAICLLAAAIFFYPFINNEPQTTSNITSQYVENTPLQTINNNENVVITHSGEKYHLPTCYHVRDKSDTITLTKQEAEKANYTPCKICIGE